MNLVPSEFAIGGVYFPPLLLASTLGVAAAALTALLLNRYRLSRFFWYPQDCADQGSDDIAQEFSEPSEDEAQVVAGGGEDGVGLVAVATFQVIALEVAL